MRSRTLVGAITTASVVIASIAVWQSVSIFVVQPIGAVPDGRTLVISRMTKLRFIDSPDGVCGRELGGVSLMCRAVVAGRVASQATIYARLPYSETLYLASTDGKTYDR